MAGSSLPKKLLTGWYHSDISQSAGNKIRVFDSYGQCVRNTCFSFVLDSPKLTKEAEGELKCMPTAMSHDMFRSWFTLATLDPQVWRTEVVLVKIPPRRRFRPTPRAREASHARPNIFQARALRRQRALVRVPP